MTKTCKSCSSNLPIELFSKHPNTLDRLQTKCKSCCSKFHKEWRIENYDTVLAEHRKYAKEFPTARCRQYGITVNEYNRIFQIQGGMCAICGIHQNDVKRSFSIDHDHLNGIVRGLLCYFCNTGIGNFKDDINFLKRAVRYLEETTVKKE